MARRVIDQKEQRIFIIFCVVLAVAMAVILYFATHQWTFEGADAVRERLASWTPSTAERTERHPVSGAILYYSINCCGGFGAQYRGEDKALRRFYKSDVETAEDIGVIAVLYFDRTARTTYTNGAKAYSKDCNIYLIEPDTLRIITTGSVLGGSVPPTTSGGDKYGSAPSLSECKRKVQKLIEECNREK